MSNQDKHETYQESVISDGRNSSSGSTVNHIDPTRGWNWGAFFLNWIWGLGNRTYIALLCFVPIFGWIWMFVLGAKGNKWAWENGQWQSVEHFKKVQRTWAWFGLAFWIAFILFFGGIIYTVSDVFVQSKPYQTAVKIAQQNPEVQAYYGTPLKPVGWPSGNIKVSGGSGRAYLSIDVEGPKAEGTLYVRAYQQTGIWYYQQIVIVNDKETKRINLTPKRKN